MLPDYNALQALFNMRFTAILSPGSLHLVEADIGHAVDRYARVNVDHNDRVPAVSDLLNRRKSWCERGYNLPTLQNQSKFVRTLLVHGKSAAS